MAVQVTDEQAAVDVTYAEIDLAIDPASRSIEGNVVTEARVVQPTATLVFDLDAPLAVSAVEEVAYVVGTGEEVALPRRCVLLFGQEGPGLSDAARERLDLVCSIAMFGSTRSINAGVASGIAMHAWIRQHALGEDARR